MKKTFEQRIPNGVRCDVILYKTKTRTRENKVVIDKTIHVLIKKKNQYVRSNSKKKKKRKQRKNICSHDTASMVLNFYRRRQIVAFQNKLWKKPDLQ